MTQIAKTGSSNAQSALGAANDLRAAMQGKVLLPADAAYATARRIWNGAVDHQPPLFAVCETTKDVQAAVTTGRWDPDCILSAILLPA
jgi:hypothetical protein